MIHEEEKQKLHRIQSPPKFGCLLFFQAYFSLFSPDGPTPTVTSLSLANMLLDFTQTIPTARNALPCYSSGWKSPALPQALHWILISKTSHMFSSRNYLSLRHTFRGICLYFYQWSIVNCILSFILYHVWN